jgi:hypothetical protein
VTNQRSERFDVGQIVNSSELFVRRVSSRELLRRKAFSCATIKRTSSRLNSFGALGVIAPRAMFVEECIVDDEQRRGLIACAHEVRGDGTKP